MCHDDLTKKPTVGLQGEIPGDQERSIDDRRWSVELRGKPRPIALRQSCCCLVCREYFQNPCRDLARSMRKEIHRILPFNVP